MIYVVTNRKLAPSMKEYYNIIERCFIKNIEAIIIREKDLEYDKLYELASNIKFLKNNSKTKLIINSNLEIAKRLNFHGIQLSYKDFVENYKCKKNLSFPGELGVSVHSVNEALDAFYRGADYILIGHIFETKCKEGLKPRGIEILRELRGKTDKKIVAIGGISKENINDVIGAGATAVAIMSRIMQGEKLP